MFSLLFGLWKYLFAKAEYHVLILGIDKAGKTVRFGLSIVGSLCKSPFRILGFGCNVGYKSKVIAPGVFPAARVSAVRNSAPKT